MRSRHSRIAVGSPARASLTALRVNASDSPARNAAAASVALLREPVQRPAGLPDRPSRKAARAPAPAVLIKSHQPSSSPRFQSAAHSGPALGRGVCNENKAILRMTKSQKEADSSRTFFLT
jgi:hypothetical protein